MENRLGIAVIALCIFGLSGSPSFAEEKSVAEEILDILKANVQITEHQYDALIIKAQDEEEQRASDARQAASNAAAQAHWADRVTLFGDFRG